MRRTAVITALASVASLTLAAAPAANAASMPRTDRLVGTASCQGGGKVALASTLDPAGAERAVLRASGVRFKHWTGRLLPDGDATAPAADGEAIVELVARHGRFTTGATRSGTGTLNASASFVSGNERGTCMVTTSHEGSRYSLASAVGNLTVQGSDGRGLLQAEIHGQPHHRYRFVFTAKTPTGRKQWKLASHTRRDGLAVAGTSTSRSRDVGSFTKVSVTVTDRTKHAAPLHLGLAR